VIRAWNNLLTRVGNTKHSDAAPTGDATSTQPTRAIRAVRRRLGNGGQLDGAQLHLVLQALHLAAVDQTGAEAPG
jgi:hypothetical protein